MRRYFTLVGCAAALSGCIKSEDRAAMDTVAAEVADSATAAETPAGVAPPTATPVGGETMSLADIAGTWAMRATPETGDTTPMQFVLIATADTSGWTIALPNRRPIATRVVAVAGDSLVTETGPYESVRRKGAQVTTRGVWRRESGRLVGIATERFRMGGGDSVLRLRVEGTRTP